MSLSSQYLKTVDAFLSPVDFPGWIRTWLNFVILWWIHTVVATLPLIILQAAGWLVVGGFTHNFFLLLLVAVMFVFPIFAFARRGILRERMEENPNA